MEKSALDDANVYNVENDDVDEQEHSAENNDNEEGEDSGSQVPNHLLPPNKRVILDQERFLPIG